jgi:hypothetical protein
MKYKLLFVLVIACLTLSESCKNRETNNSRENYIRNIIGKELILNDSLMKNGEDSCLYANELYKPLKIVVYSDSLSCACELNLPLWKIRFKELQRNNTNVGLVFIINTNDISSVELDIKATKVQGKKLYDFNGVFEKYNDLYDDIDLHVFLID